MSAEQNPYESPNSDISTFSQDRQGEEGASQAEQIRRKYLNHEASVKSVGLLFYLSAGIFAFVAIATLRYVPALAIRHLAFGIVAGFVGHGLRSLKSWARIPLAILIGLGLVNMFRALASSAGNPIRNVVPMAIYLYILYLAWCAKGKYVCSDEYHTIIAQTPHIKYKPSIIVEICVGLLLLVVVLGMLSELDPKI